VIDEAGEHVGVMPKEAALNLAKEKNLDLIKIVPPAKPPVAQIISFDKFRYQKEKEWKKKGDLGIVAEEFVKEKKQRTLANQELTTKHVYDNIRKLAELEGQGTVDRKVSLVAELLSNAKPEEARFIVRTILDELRVGVKEGIIRDSISKAFGAEAKDVEHAFNMTADYGEVCKLAARQAS